MGTVSGILRRKRGPQPRRASQALAPLTLGWDEIAGFAETMGKCVESKQNMHTHLSRKYGGVFDDIKIPVEENCSILLIMPVVA